MTRKLGNIKEAQSLQADADSAGPKAPGKEITEETTNLKLISFSIEVETDPVTLLVQTDKGPFSVEIPKDQLSHLVYALRFVLYADEALREKRPRRQAEAGRLYASAGSPKEKGQATPTKRPPRANEKKGGKKQK